MDADVHPFPVRKAAIDERLGHRIRSERNQRGLSQEQLAQELGVSVGTIVRWESAKARPQRSHQRSVAKWIGIPFHAVEELLAGADNPAVDDVTAVRRVIIDRLSRATGPVGEFEGELMLQMWRDAQRRIERIDSARP